MVAHAGKVFNPAAADKNGRVLLKVVTFAGNVNGTFLLVGKAHPGNLSYSRVRLFRSRGGNRKAHAALLGALFNTGSLGLVNLLFSAVLYKLVDCRHLFPPCFTRLLSACGIYLLTRTTP